MADAGDIFNLVSIEFAPVSAIAAPVELAEPEPLQLRAISPAVRLRNAASCLLAKAKPPKQPASAPANDLAAPPKLIADADLSSEPLAARRRPASAKGLHLSLVVACYNVELYIERFLDSVFSRMEILIGSR